MTRLEGLNEDFRDLVAAFVDGQVEFVIVGAFALAFHGAPRASGDIDLFVRAEPENARRLIKALGDFGAPIEAHGIQRSDFELPGKVYQIGLPPRRIDILTEISGVTFDEARASSAVADVDGRPIHIIGRDALIKNKIASGRPKDLADVARLTKSPGPRT
jgi:Nucleotidyl transferase AbiEii toxin, Type IV TA system